MEWEAQSKKFPRHLDQSKKYDQGYWIRSRHSGFLIKVEYFGFLIKIEYFVRTVLCVCLNLLSHLRIQTESLILPFFVQVLCYCWATFLRIIFIFARWHKKTNLGWLSHSLWAPGLSPPPCHGSCFTLGAEKNSCFHNDFFYNGNISILSFMVFLDTENTTEPFQSTRSWSATYIGRTKTKRLNTSMFFNVSVFNILMSP